jgi:molybdenum cofactor biosynthesis protein B
VRIFVITCSDTRTLETDESGQLAERLITAAGHGVAGRVVVRDEPTLIEGALRNALAAGAEAVVLNGGTGLSRRDRTFDALEKLLTKRIDGFGELFRMLSYEQVGAAAMLSRATAGLFEGKPVFSVPGSPAAVQLALEKLILPEIGHVVREAAR